jgi:hypothetical protein
MDGKIFNSQGVHVGVVMDDEVFSLNGQKLYDLKGSKHLQVEWRPSWSFAGCARGGETIELDPARGERREGARR